MKIIQSGFFEDGIFKLSGPVCAILLLASCSSNPSVKSGMQFGSDPQLASSSMVDSAAYGADGFAYSKPMYKRPSNDFVFFFKHCGQVSNRSWYSKTDYYCAYP